MARSQIGRLEIQLLAEISKFRKALSDAQRQATNTANKLTRTFKAAGAAFAGAFTAGAVIRAVDTFVSKNLEAADAIGRVRDRIGVSVKGYQQLAFAAKSSEVPIEALNMALQRQTRRISEAAQGSGEAKNALRELGLDAQKLSKLTPDQQFFELAKAFDQVQVSGDKSRLAMRLWDSEGVRLLQTLSGGSEGLEEFAKRAEELGGIMSEDLVNRSIEINQRFTDIGRKFQDVSVVLFEHLAPALEVATHWLTQFFNVSRVREVAVIEGEIERVKEKIEELTKPSLYMGFLTIPNLFRTGKLAEAEMRLQNLQEELAKAKDRLEAATESGGEFVSTLGKAPPTVKGLAGATNELNEATKEQIEASAKIQAFMEEINNEYEDQIRLAEELKIEQARTRTLTIKGLEDELRLMRESARQGVAVNQLKRQEETLRKANVTATSAQGKEILKLLDLIDQENERIAAQKDEVEKMQKIWDEALEGIQRGWVKMWEDIFSGRALRSVKDFLESVKQLFIRLAAEIAAAFTIKKIFGGLFGFDLGALFGAGVGAASTSKSAGGGLAAIFSGSALVKAAKAAKAKIAAIFGGGGGAVATGLGGAVPAGAVGGTLGPIFVGQPIGAGVAAAPAAPASSGLLAAAAANPAVAAAIAALAVFGGYKIFGGGRSRAQILADEIKEVSASVDQVRATAPEMFRLFEDTSAKFLGGGFRSQFLEFGTDKAAESFANYARTVSDLGVDVQGTFVRLIDEKAKLEDSSTWISGVDQLVERYDQMKEQVTEIFKTLSGDALSQLATIQLDAENVAAVLEDGFVTSAESASLGIRGLGNVSADVFRQLVLNTQQAFSTIELNSKTAAEAMADNIVTAAELASLGIHGLGDMSAATFRSIVANARAAAEAAQQVSAVVGGPTPGLGPTPVIAAPPPPRRRADYIASLGGQHGGTFQVGGRGGIDANSLRVSRGERITVETPGQAGKTIELLAEILNTLRRQGKDMARVLAVR